MPIPTKIKRNIGTKGLAEVRVLKNSLRVIFQDGDQYEVEKGDWNRPSGLYDITLAPLNDKILFVSPAPNSTYLVRFKEFGNRENEVPAPYIKRGGLRKGKNGSQWLAPDELTVSAKLEVLDPKSPYQGLNLVYTIPYAFEKYPGATYATITASQSRLTRIEEFLRLCGLDFAQDEIPFSDNVLPWLEERFQQAAKVFTVTTNEKGYIKTMAEVPEYLLPPDLTAKPKKAARKPRAKKASKK